MPTESQVQDVDKQNPNDTPLKNLIIQSDSDGEAMKEEVISNQRE